MGITGFKTGMHAFESDNRNGVVDDYASSYTTDCNEWLSENMYVVNNSIHSTVVFEMPTLRLADFKYIDLRAFISLLLHLPKKIFAFESRTYQRYLFMEDNKTLVLFRNDKLKYQASPYNISFLMLDWEATWENAQKREADTPSVKK